MLRFAHFDLQQSDNCNDANDQLLISELDLRPYCVTPNTKKITTKSSSVSVRFKTNGQGDSQGFRAFYSAGKLQIYQTYCIQNETRLFLSLKKEHEAQSIEDLNEFLFILKFD